MLGNRLYVHKKTRVKADYHINEKITHTETEKHLLEIQGLLSQLEKIKSTLETKPKN
jgi:hypothetical protein